VLQCALTQRIGGEDYSRAGFPLRTPNATEDAALNDCRSLIPFALFKAAERPKIPE